METQTVTQPKKHAKQTNKIYKYQLWLLASKRLVLINAPLIIRPVFEDLAEICDVKPETVYRWANLSFNSKCEIGTDDLIKIAAYFETKAVDVYSEYYRINYLGIK